jgi:hypothetical protein
MTSGIALLVLLALVFIVLVWLFRDSDDNRYHDYYHPNSPDGYGHTDRYGRHHQPHIIVIGGYPPQFGRYPSQYRQGSGWTDFLLIGAIVLGLMYFLSRTGGKIEGATPGPKGSGTSTTEMPPTEAPKPAENVGLQKYLERVSD